MLDILAREEYGALPPAPEHISWTAEEIRCNFCCGNATLHKVIITSRVAGQDFSFPVYCAIPTAQGRYPFFVHINFRDSVPDRYMPTEELIDNGFAVLSFCYEDVTGDNGDFTTGLAGVLYGGRARGAEDPGKIALWAWAAQRVLDYALTLDTLLPEGAVVCGHSRLGKTALLAAATDERFAFAYSNDSGCSGAAITRNKAGERVADITTNFPYWFCENYQQYRGREREMPFDQHWLIAAIAPRYVLVGSATEDEWADPASEMMGCIAASPAWERLGKPGFTYCDRLPVVGDIFTDGCVGYHLRQGLHYFGREDWKRLMAFVLRKLDESGVRHGRKRPERLLHSDMIISRPAGGRA